jgi:choline kinase
MHAILLAADPGPFQADHDLVDCPACLLEFEGHSLLALHLAELVRLGVTKAEIVVGSEARRVIDHISELSERPDVAFHFNPRFELGSVLNLMAAAEALRTVECSVVLDTAAIFAPEVLHRLVESPQENCLLFDGSRQPAGSSIGIALHEGRVVDFGRRLGSVPGSDALGVMPGLFRIGSMAAACIADECERFEREGLADSCWEEAVRGVLRSCPLAFGIEDISGLPWSALENEDELVRITETVLPAIRAQSPAA